MSQNPISLTKLPISIVIPTYCEEKTLPKLLKSIQDQIIGPYEVIVADAQSPDKTREIAKKYGCIVVEGGKVAVGRNNGAKAATQEYLLFLDADTRLPTNTTLIRAFSDFLQSESDIASTGYLPEKEGATVFGYYFSGFIFAIWNLLRDVQSIVQVPSIEGGAFILVKKTVFSHLGGFRLDLNVGEDKDFFGRAGKYKYKYRHLKEDVFTSTRRYESPKKAFNALLSAAFIGGIITLGAYWGSKTAKRMYSKYGRLGGGEGRDPNDD